MSETTRPTTPPPVRPRMHQTMLSAARPTTQQATLPIVLPTAHPTLRPAARPTPDPNRGDGSAWPSDPAFRHEGLFYSGVDDYLTGTVPFVLEGLAGGEPVMVAVPGPNLARITEALGAAAGAVRLLDMAVAGRNPGRIIGSVLSRFFDEHPGRRVRIIGEPVWAERSAAEYPACVQHEALINVAFAGRDGTILCPYDTRRLSPDALLDATRTHPILVDRGRRGASPGYADPVRLAACHDMPLAEPPPSAEVELMIFDSAIGARGVRRFVHEHAERAGLPADRIADLRDAVHEVALNTLLHTAAPGILSVWAEDGHLICEVQDSGSISDPLFGRHAPEPYDGRDDRGSGLYLVHQLCDLVRTHVTEHGLTTRIYLRLPSPSPSLPPIRGC